MTNPNVPTMLPTTNGAWFLGSVKKYRMFYLIINVKKHIFIVIIKAKSIYTMLK